MQDELKVATEWIEKNWSWVVKECDGDTTQAKDYIECDLNQDLGTELTVEQIRNIFKTLSL